MPHVCTCLFESRDLQSLECPPEMLIDPSTILGKTFENPEKYSEPVVLRDIPFVSHCEHHLAPINGFADVAYVPSDRIVGISK